MFGKLDDVWGIPTMNRSKRSKSQVLGTWTKDIPIGRSPRRSVFSLRLGDFVRLAPDGALGQEVLPFLSQIIRV